MKFNFPKLDYDLVCEKCWHPIVVDMATSEDGDIDGYWCEYCLDFRGGKYLDQERSL